MSEGEILFERRGTVGLVTLNRPQALNALTFEMVLALRAQLATWQSDSAVAAVVLRGAGERAFCAGGDIRTLYEWGRAGDPRRRDFFRHEYRLNHAMKTYPKPLVALVDGLVMGGGVGVSVHGRYRVATQRIGFAMPEVGIGFFPDVGATFFLPRLPGFLGTYYALTGERARQADSLHAGIATHAVPAAALAELVDALAEADDPGPVLDRFAADPGAAPIAVRREVIDRCFSADSVAEILARLDAERGEDAEWAARTAATMRTKSPTSLCVALLQMRRGAALDFTGCMRLEFRIVSRLLLGHDFDEGVRAAIIDKDNRPRWRPATLAEVDPAAIDAVAAPLPEGDLDLETGPA